VEIGCVDVCVIGLTDRMVGLLLLLNFVIENLNLSFGSSIWDGSKT
jgi:hypothetical protein